MTLVWVPLWVIYVRDSPKQHPGISRRELDLLSKIENQPRASFLCLFTVFFSYFNSVLFLLILYSLTDQLILIFFSFFLSYFAKIVLKSLEKTNIICPTEKGAMESNLQVETHLHLYADGVQQHMAR